MQKKPPKSFNEDDEDEFDSVEDIRQRRKRRRALNKSKGREEPAPERGEPPRKRPRRRVKWNPDWDEADWAEVEENFEDF